MPLERYRAWKHKNAAVGCVFARYMAATPHDGGQHAVVVNGSDPAVLAASIDALVTADVADPNIQGIAMVFPDVTDLEVIARTALALESYAGWHVARRLLAATPAGDVIVFNVVREVRRADGVPVPSEALVLGPFEGFPNTRQAPVAAMEVFVGTPPTHQPNGSETKKAHLADVRLQLPAAGVFERMWNQSKQARLDSLGFDDDRARAKVTFVIPFALAQSIGCVP